MKLHLADWRWYNKWTHDKREVFVIKIWKDYEDSILIYVYYSSYTLQENNHIFFYFDLYLY